MELSGDYSNRQHRNINDPRRTFFFTDRAIYRPGQTIRLKGISARMDTDKNEYETIANDEVRLMFRDVNGKSIEEVDRYARTTMVHFTEASPRLATGSWGG